MLPKPLLVCVLSMSRQELFTSCHPSHCVYAVQDAKVVLAYGPKEEAGSESRCTWPWAQVLHAQALEGLQVSLTEFSYCTHIQGIFPCPPVPPLQSC